VAHGKGRLWQGAIVKGVDELFGATRLPPLYLSRKNLAAALDMAESTVDEMVKRRVLPAPIHLSPGCVRWCCAEVVTALASLKDTQRAPGSTDGDPYLQGVRNVTKVSEGRRGTPEERA